MAPHSLHSASDNSEPSASTRRICRQLAVEATETESGVHAQLVCKVVLAAPTSADQQDEPVRLLRNIPLARLAHKEAYALPLSATSPATALEAARKLGIQPPLTPEREPETPAEEQRSATPLARRRSSVASLKSAAGRAPLRIQEQGDGIFLRLDPAPTVRTGTSSADGTSASSTTPTGGSCEYLVVLHFDLSTGRLHLPHFANSISIPTPLCLRNALTLTLPSPSPDSPFSAWDLSVRPSLSNAASLLHTASNAASTQITGNFPSTASLSLRWAPQLAPGDEARLLLPHATVSTAWEVEPGQVARAQVDVQVEFGYSGLREKQWVEIELGAPRTAVDVLDCVGTSGTTVLDWEVVAAETSSSVSSRSYLTNPSSPDLSLVKPVGRKTSGSSLGLGVPSPATPSTRRRRSSNRPAEARPPGFHSLFDTAMPAPPVLDTSFVTEISSSDLLDTSRRHASSGSSSRRGASDASVAAVDSSPPMEQDADLLRQAAPFDPEASALDMSFEVGSLPSSTHSTSTNGDLVPNPVASDAPAPTSAARTIVRVQVDLGPALRAFAVDSLADRPYLAVRLSLAGKSNVDVGATGSAPLPSIQFPSAETEDRVVTACTQSGLRLALDNGGWESVCDPGGKLRWTTSRSASRQEEAGIEPLRIVLLPRSSSVETSPQLSAVADGRSVDEELTPLLDETEVSFAESLDADVDTSFATVTPGPDDQQHSTALHETSASFAPDALEAEEVPEARKQDSPESVPDRTANLDGRETAAAADPVPTPMQDEETQTVLPSPTMIEAVAPPSAEKPDTRDSAVQTLPLPSSKSAKSGTRTTASRDDPLVKSLTRLLMLVTLALIGTQGWHYLRGGHPSPIARYRSRYSMPKYPVSRHQQQHEHTRNANTLVSFDRKTATVTQTVFSTETRVATVTSVSTRTEHRTITSLHSLTTTVPSSTPTTNPRPLPVYSDDFTAAAPATPSSTIVSPPSLRRPDPAALPSINEAPTVAAQFVIWLHSVRLELRGFLSRWRDWLRL